MKTPFLIFLLPILVFGQVKQSTSRPSNRLSKTSVFQYKNLDGNAINCTISSGGPFADYRATNSSGLEWPKGTGKTAIYTAGIWLGGIHRPTKELRISHQYYDSEFQPGIIPDTFNTSTNNESIYIDGSYDPRYRLYKINRNDTLHPTLNSDYREWPGDLGAPYLDVNMNGVWDAGIDKPQFFGDQQIWCVYNDANITCHNNFSLSKPMGIEVQVLYAASRQFRYYENSMFIRWRIINKSDADYDSVYFGIFSDFDLGDANDDLPGCDTLLNLGYVYNGSDFDPGTHGYGAQPPAVGFQLINGPRIPGVPSDSARVGGIWRHGFRQLTMTSFVFVHPLAWLPDWWWDGDYYYDSYYFLKGGYPRLTDLQDSRFKFTFSGDPIAKTGNLPENFPLGIFAPQDIMILLSSGPFTLAKRDTQEIVAALLICQGKNRLESLQFLKNLASYTLLEDFSGDAYFLPTPMPVAPELYALKQNYPNPFNPETVIQYELPGPAHAIVRIYNALGQLTATLVDEEKGAGIHRTVWNSTTQSGAQAASGVYFYSLEANGSLFSRKMILIR